MRRLARAITTVSAITAQEAGMINLSVEKPRRITSIKIWCPW